jgi:hypothetical protein
LELEVDPQLHFPTVMQRDIIIEEFYTKQTGLSVCLSVYVCAASLRVRLSSIRLVACSCRLSIANISLAPSVLCTVNWRHWDFIYLWCTLLWLDLCDAMCILFDGYQTLRGGGDVQSSSTLKMETRGSSITFVSSYQCGVEDVTSQKTLNSMTAFFCISDLTWCSLIAYYGPAILNVVLRERVAELWQNFVCGKECEMGLSSCMKDAFPVLPGRIWGILSYWTSVSTTGY